MGGSNSVHETITKKNQEYISEMNRIKVGPFSNSLTVPTVEQSIVTRMCVYNNSVKSRSDGTLDSNALSNQGARIGPQHIEASRALFLD